MQSKGVPVHVYLHGMPGQQHVSVYNTVKPGYNEADKNSQFFVTWRFSLHAGFELRLA